MDSSNEDQIQPHFIQNVVVMRHGDRIDSFEPLWPSTAARPWDPPLVDAGKVRAFYTGRKFRNQLGFPIHRVFVSPFLRCLQTASEVVSALCAVADQHDDPNDMSSHGVEIDPSKIKASIEYGLCEMLNPRAIRLDVAPEDGDFGFNIFQCESVLPAGTIDHTVEQVYKEMPQWQETVEGARARYPEVMKALADKYPSENLLLVTHGEGVGSVVSRFVQEADMVYDVAYCGYSHSKRPIFFSENQSFTAGDFVGSHQGQVGINFTHRNTESNDHLDKLN
ncbi:uncharacterized protein LOC111387271 [Olea europaea var. sylvestris]|nr:uncharacterized protein LOC111387271 [Olea europaea var. sylvestris]